MKLPSVTGLLLVGVLLGPQISNVLNQGVLDRLSFIEPLALSVITFIIGEKLHFKRLAKLGARSLFLSMTEIALLHLLTRIILLLNAYLFIKCFVFGQLRDGSGLPHYLEGVTFSL